jgi:two-component system, chemotaxis family, protein-glutamate methylesterase/glutaminase
VLQETFLSFAWVVLPVASTPIPGYCGICRPIWVVAIVIVNHLRTVATLLHEILPRYTAMPVELITEKLLIQPNRVFVIPEQRDLHVLDGEFRLKPISKPRGWPDVITVFLRSLTQHWGGKLIAVIVSGYDGDGAAALCGIKEVGGLPLRRSSTQPASQICRKAQ